MSDTVDANDPHSISAAVELTVRGQPLRLEMRIPIATVRVRDLLPLFQWVSEAMIDVGVRQATRDGQHISCCQGCGACCRQLVPVAPAEAHALAELIESLPEPRRQQIRQRFAAAWERLHQEGMMDALMRLESMEAAERQKLALRYFSLGIACPFLEHESCSIYEHRPIACREYLVTSPAEYCARPNAQDVRVLKPPGGAAWRAVASLESPAPARRRVVPLILAPQFAASHDEDASVRDGPTMVRRFFDALGNDGSAESE